MKALRSIWNLFVFMLTGKGEIGKEAVNNGICDFSGQGRGQSGR